MEVIEGYWRVLLMTIDTRGVYEDSICRDNAGGYAKGGS